MQTPLLDNKGEQVSIFGIPVIVDESVPPCAFLLLGNYGPWGDIDPATFKRIVYVYNIGGEVEIKELGTD